MLYYSYETFSDDVKALIQRVRPFQPEAIIAVARGGMMLGQLMGYGLNLRNIQSIHVEAYDDAKRREAAAIFGVCDIGDAKRVLVVDDIVDSGMTMQALLERLRTQHPQTEFKTASIFYKPEASLQPDFTLKEAEAWINFFWEVDFSDA